MGLLDFFWKRGGTDPEKGTTTHESAEAPGQPAEGPPVGVSDPGDPDEPAEPDKAY